MPRHAAALAVLAASLVLTTGAHAATFTVTSTADAGPGTLREAIADANSNSGPDAIHFDIPGAGRHVISVQSRLPELTGDDTTIDATTQPGYDDSPLMGTGGTVGADGVGLPRLRRPVIEIRAGADIGSALRIRGAVDAVVRGLHLQGGEFSFFVLESPGILIEDNLIGTDAAFGPPDADVRSRSVLRLRTNSTGAVIRDNLIGYSNNLDCMRFEDGSDGALVEGNEIAHCGVPDDDTDDAITFDEAGGATIRANLLRDGVSSGVSTLGGSTGVTIDDNTIRDNGSGGDETAAVALSDQNGLPVRGAIVRRNVITGNVGPGVMVTGSWDDGELPSEGNTISENAIFANAIGIDLDARDEGLDQGDGVTLNDPADADIGGNGLLNFPVIDSALSGSLVLSGWAAPGARVEFFLADPDGSGFGEGRRFIGAGVEGGPQDRDPTTSAYGPGPVNGVLQGSDAANRFRFVLASPPNVGPGTPITATATVGAGTSEFGGLAVVQRANADLAIAKTGPQSAQPGSTVAYTIEVTNDGPDLAEATVDDPTPPGLALVAATGDCTTGFPCALGPLEPGDRRDIVATYRVDATAAGSIANTATVQTAALDADTGNDSATALTAIEAPPSPPPAPPEPPAPPPASVPAPVSVTAPSLPSPAATPAGRPRLAIAQRALPAVVRAGGLVTYTIIVRSVGAATARRVRVCERLPRAFRRGGRSVCRHLGSLAPGATRRVRVRARAPRGPRATLATVALATASARDTATRTARARVVVLPAPPPRPPARFTG